MWQPRYFEVVYTGVKLLLFDVYLLKAAKKLQFSDFLCKFANQNIYHEQNTHHGYLLNGHTDIHIGTEWTVQKPQHFATRKSGRPMFKIDIRREITSDDG